MTSICIGSAQFGMPYGVTNQNGQVSKNEVSKILATAYQLGITHIDTAQSYGAAESILGALCKPHTHFKFTSKLKSFDKSIIEKSDQLVLDHNLEITCKQHNIQYIDKLHLHNIAHLKYQGTKYL